MAQTAGTVKDWLRSKEAQEYLGVSHDKFYSLVKQGAFPVSKPHGRLTYVKRADLEIFLRSGFATQ